MPATLEQAGPNHCAATLRVARFDDFELTNNNVVFADDDGCVVVSEKSVAQILTVGRDIWEIERRQADRIKGAKTLRQQLQFTEYLAKRSRDPAHTVRQHLGDIAGAIEE